MLIKTLNEIITFYKLSVKIYIIFILKNAS